MAFIQYDEVDTKKRGVIGVEYYYGLLERTKMELKKYTELYSALDHTKIQEAYRDEIKNRGLREVHNICIFKGQYDKNARWYDRNHTNENLNGGIEEFRGWEEFMKTDIFSNNSYDIYLWHTISTLESVSNILFSNYIRCMEEIKGKEMCDQHIKK